MKSSLSRALVTAALLAAALSSAQADTPHLYALSTRGFVGTNDQILIAGFVIGPGAPKQLVIRASGPALQSTFNISGTLADPILEIHDSTGAIVSGGSNDNWNAADAATYASVGLYPFQVGSKDSGLVITLPPGGYTAQVKGNNSTTGIAAVEIYEVGTSTTRITALSTRGQVGTGDSVLIPGLVISAGTGTRRMLIRADGPALAGLGVANTLADPTVVVINSAGATVASNNDWGTPIGINPFDAPTLAAAFTAAGEFSLAAGSKDSALMVDLVPGNYTVEVSGVNNTSGLGLVEIYDVTPAGPGSVSITASIPNADESGTNNGEFTVTRTGDTSTSLAVNYTLSGAATNGSDYQTLSGTVTIPAGSASSKIAVNPLPDLETEGNESVIATLSPSSSYTLGAGTSATVIIADSPATLYVASLRPAAGTTSSASGSATIVLNSSGTLATINVSFSNLSSGETSAHLRLGPSGDFVYNLGTGQAVNEIWTFTPTGTYSMADLINALKSGNIYVGIDTATNPSGEVAGTFLQSTGSQSFTAPAAPPAIDLTHATATDAARLLQQATFGPKQAEIDALTNTSITAWITAQEALPFTSHRTATDADFNTYGGASNGSMYAANRQAAWWKIITSAPDQLRQRTALALSEIMVVSDVPFSQSFTEGLANYYDVLGNGAFGNFRTLLENVTLNPVMGNYLSSLRNAKANPATGTSPDENYAREVMQLFTIGLNMLQPDGTLQLDNTGQPIPTYNQTTVTEMAKVFTGWSYYSTNSKVSFQTGAADYIDPMMLFSAYHDDSQKYIVNNVIIPPSQGGTQDLKVALDTLFNHPNTGPFISRQLIQRLVTSNPSPGYVYRVAQVFANNGSGVRGDLGAVVRAILSDYEARSPAVISNLGFGKLREPLLRATALVRTFNGTPNGNRFSSGLFTNPDVNLDEASLRSPTVFNFFHPGYVLPGPLASAGLVAPEFEITDATFSIDVPNYLRSFVLATGNPLLLDLSTEQTLVTNPSALLDRLNNLMCGGNMPAATKTRITTALTALPTATTALERAETAVLLVATAPTSAIQK